MLMIYLRDGSKLALSADSADDALAWKLAFLETKRNLVTQYNPDDHYQAVTPNAFNTIYINPRNCSHPYLGLLNLLIARRISVKFTGWYLGRYFSCLLLTMTEVFPRRHLSLWARDKPRLGPSESMLQHRWTNCTGDACWGCHRHFAEVIDVVPMLALK
ncbi:pleckstrin homology domain-containing family B member 1 isoform X3 [Chiloscyllium punctatum]